MRLVVYLLERLNIGVGIHLRRAKRAMSEEFLYLAQVGTIIQQMGGEGVAKHVRRGLTLYAIAL